MLLSAQLSYQNSLQELSPTPFYLLFPQNAYRLRIQFDYTLNLLAFQVIPFYHFVVAINFREALISLIAPKGGFFKKFENNIMILVIIMLAIESGLSEIPYNLQGRPFLSSNLA